MLDIGCYSFLPDMWWYLLDSGSRHLSVISDSMIFTEFLSVDATKNDYFTRLPAAMCVKLLIDILGTDIGKDPTIEGLCLKCLHLLGDKLKRSL